MEIEIVPDGIDRKIIIVRSRGASVRVEVEDTGGCICIDTPVCIATLESGADMAGCVGVQIPLMMIN